MARKCTLNPCKSELPSKADSDKWQAVGFCDDGCMARHGLAKAKKQAERKRKADELGIKKRNQALKKKVKANPKAKALESAQLLARISSADDDGYCTCVTCGHVGKFNEGFDGGHFIAKGNCSFWMLDPRNIWPQCKSCNGNGMKFGNKEAAYTLWMLDKFGREFVDYMRSMEKEVTKRTAKDYEEFTVSANAQILIHKKRIGIK